MMFVLGIVTFVLPVSDIISLYKKYSLIMSEGLLFAKPVKNYRRFKIMASGKIVLKSVIIENIGQRELSVEIISGGKAAPMVTLGENIGCPVVSDFYAKSIRIASDSMFVDGSRLNNVFEGIELTIRFDSPITAEAATLVVNLFQEDAVEFKLANRAKLSLAGQK